MSIKKILLSAMILGILNIFIIGCSDKGTAEKAGKKIDNAIEAAKEKFKEKTSE